MKSTLFKLHLKYIKKYHSKGKPQIKIKLKENGDSEQEV